EFVEFRPAQHRDRYFVQSLGGDVAGDAENQRRQADGAAADADTDGELFAAFRGLEDPDAPRIQDDELIAWVTLAKDDRPRLQRQRPHRSVQKLPIARV